MTKTEQLMAEHRKLIEDSVERLVSLVKPNDPEGQRMAEIAAGRILVGLNRIEALMEADSEE